MPRTIEKPEALELLEKNRRELLPNGDGCVMCALVRRARESSELLRESEHGVALLDRFGSRAGHVIIVSRRHVEDTADLTWEAYSDLQRLAYEASSVLRKSLNPARVFIAVLGASSELPMSFPHFHVHALPVYETDERARPAFVFSWSAGVLVYTDEEAGELAGRLRNTWRTQSSER